MKIIMAHGRETGNYNERTCCDGGGYWQYAGWAVFANGVSVRIENNSCGGYGTRIFTEFFMPDGWIYLWCIGTMDDSCIDNEEAERIADSMWGRYGLDANAMFLQAKEAIDAVAWHWYYEEQDEEG